MRTASFEIKKNPGVRIVDLINTVRNAGVIGAGGAGFPTYAKLTSKAEYILLNGAECEPLLRVDQQLMEKYPHETILGLVAAGRQVEAQKALIGVKKKHKKLIEILEGRIQALKLEDYVEVMPLRDVYPAGDEQVLVYELTKRVVPELGIPLKVGCVVINAETALNICRALQGEAVTHTYLTLAGDIPEPVTLKAPVGISVGELLQGAGIPEPDSYAVISGGPMMGTVMESMDEFVTKRSKGFILLKKDHFLIKRKTVSLERARVVSRTACEQCRMCTDLCPRYLLGHNMQPHKMMRTLGYQLRDISEQDICQLCCECNVCELFACPVNIHPRAVNMLYKKKLAEEGHRYEPVKLEFEPRAARDFRLIPSKRLISKLGLTAFDGAAPLREEEYAVSQVEILLSQHIGKPAEPMVKEGDAVTRGQMIGRPPEEGLGAAVHASIDGIVAKADNFSIGIKVG